MTYVKSALRFACNAKGYFREMLVMMSELQTIKLSSKGREQFCRKNAIA